MNDSKASTGVISRRQFLGSTATAVAAFTIVPRHVLGGPGHVPPSDKLNLACVGIGGRGRADLFSVRSENIVAVCDVDDEQMANTLNYKLSNEGQTQESAEITELLGRLQNAKKYRDYRKMLDENHKSIDAVVVATPDHTHAVIAMAAIKMGKHVYCEKPLTHSIGEARALAEAARKAKVVTQMGNQGHASEEIRLIKEWIADGAIGEVREAHCWTNRPIWPQGIDRPEAIPSVPSTLDWDLWIGPAKFRPYHPAYAPFAWRGWWDFGTGALGDMGAHIFDVPFWALDLNAPTSVMASCTRFNEQTYPIAEVVHYEFASRGKMPAVKLTWWDGGLMPSRPPELEEGRRMGDVDGGVLLIGDKGTIMCGTYAKNARIIPETKMQAYKRPAKTIPRTAGIHEDWIACCKSNKPACSNFDVAAPLTETMLLANLAVRASDKQTPLMWDGANAKVTNMPELDEFVNPAYRTGWSL
ncbi:Gfo/Idh/MocA family oxidoreductase [candidate division KSB1 bacterium]|nr:Gfo/Idh/MocA family oxidoreductase [candidate division KSB1 bacterium]